MIILLTLAGLTSWGQGSYNMVNGDTIFIYPCQSPTGTIYDNGGATGNYDCNFDGWAILSVPAGVTISLTGDYHTESGYDKICVYDGRGRQGQLLANEVSGSGTLSVQSSTGWLSILFHTDGSVVNPGFALSYSISGVGVSCSNPIEGLTATAITTTSAIINWTAADNNSTFTVNLGDTLLTASGNSLTLNQLNPNTFYSVSVSDAADNMAPCCQQTIEFRTLCGVMNAPIIERFDDHGIGSDVVPSCWTRQMNYDDNENRYPQVSGVQYVSSPGSLLMFCGANNVAEHWSLAIGPEISDDLASLFVRFNIRATNANARIEVGVCDDTSLIDNNFTPVDTITVTAANTWQEVVTNLSAYGGDGHRFAFRMMRGLQPGNGVTIYIDNLIIEPCGVWHISRQHRSTHDFYVQWDNIGQPAVSIEIGPEIFLPGTGTMHTNVTSPYHFTGLEAGTAYLLRFYSNCGGVERQQSSTVATTLAHDATALDVCEDFEVGGDNLPAGWRRATIYDNTPRFYSYAAHSGSRGLMFRPYASGNIHPVAVMPGIDTTAVNQLSLKFWLRSDGYNTGYIEIGVMDYPEYADSFTPVDTVYATTTWSAHAVSLASYTGTGRHIAFRAYNSMTNYDYLYLDDLQVGPCLIGGQTVTNIAAHRVELRWDTVEAGFHADSVTIEYGGAGFAEGSGTIVRVPVSGNSVQTIDGKQRYVVSGLEADSSYEFLIYGECAGSTVHCQFARLTARTLQADIALPYCQQFDGLSTGGLPSGWSRPRMYDSRPRIWDSHNRSGDRSLQLLALGNLGYEHAVAVMPMFDVDSVSGLTVSFYSYGTTNYAPRIQVGVMDNPTDEGTFTVVSTVSLANGSWQSHVVDLSSYTGTGRYIAFRYYHEDCDGCYFDAYIDDIVVSDAATASKNVYSVSSHGASFRWKGVGRAYAGAVIEWGPQGFEPGTIRSDTLLATEPTDANGFYRYTVDTLQPGTTYDLFITALSNGLDDLCTYSRLSFTTAAEPLQSSYCYGFEDLAPETYPWNYSWYRPLRYGAEPRAVTETHSGSYAMYLRAYCNNNAATGDMSLAAMPYLEEDDLEGLTLRFWAHGSGSYSRLKIGFMTDPGDTSTFEGIDTLTVDHYDWRQYSIDLGQYSGTGRHIAFWLYCLPDWNSGYFYFDDITISRCRISDVSHFSQTTSSFNLRWTPEGSIDSIQIEYGIAGFTPGTGTTLIVDDPSTTSLAITGLQPGTTYDYYVRPYCSGSGNICAEQHYTTHTLSSPVAAGYCEDFEAYSNNQRPADWTLLQSHDGWPFTWTHDNSAYYTSYRRAFEFRTNYAGGNLIAMPAAEDELAGLILSFNIRCSDAANPSRPILEVGVMTLPYDAATFIPVDTIRPTYNYRGVTVSFNSYNGTGRHIAFRYTDDSYRITYIDDLRLSRCLPAQVRPSMIADTSLTISWSPLGYDDTTFILYDTAGAPSLSHSTISLGTSATISGLQPDRTYQFRLYGSCQDTALQCQGAALTATTLSAPFIVPVCETFEGYPFETPPDGWTIPIDVPYTYTISASHSGQRAMRLTVRGAGAPLVSFAVMPYLHTDDISSTYFDAWLSSDVMPAMLTVGIMTDPYDTTSFIPIQSFTPTPGAWTHIKCPFADYSGTGHYVAFRASGGLDGLSSLYLDDINLRSCAVTSAKAITPTENSISLQWSTSADNPAVVVEYKATGSYAGDFLPGTGTTITLTDSPHTFPNLQEATWYSFHLYPICDSISDGCNYESTFMQTLHPWVDLPYCENFENISGSLPNNWLNLSSSSVPYRDYTYYGHDSTRTNFARLVASSTDSTLFVLPRIYIGSACPVLDKLYANFWTYGSSNIASGIFEIGVMTDANDPATFVPHDTLYPQPGLWQHHTASITAYNTASHYVAFRFRSSNGESVSCDFDDLCMEKCVAAGITVSDITQHSVTITWDNYSVDTLICEYAPAGTPVGSGAVVAITQSPYTITDLADGSQYQFTFATLCGCQQYGTAYTGGGGSWGSAGGWGGGGWGWWCCTPCHYDSTQLCRLWRWGPWTGHSWSWWQSQSSGGGNLVSPLVTPPVVDVTTQAAMLETPYCETFEIADSLLFPPSWRRKADSHYPDIVTNNSHSGSKSMRFYATTGSSCHAALPPLQMGLTSSMVLTFYAYSTNVNATSVNARFEVGVMNDPDNLSTFTPIDTIRLSSVAHWQQCAVSFAHYGGEGQYIAFRFAPTGQSYSVYIDNLYLGPCAITDVAAIPDQSEVTVSWTSLGAPDHVQIAYGPQGADPIQADTLFRTTDAYSSPTVVTIDPDSSYDFYVSTVCNDSASSCFLQPLTVNPSLLMPYCEDFEGYLNDMLPDRWKVIQRNSSRTMYPLTETQHEGRQILAFYPGTGTNNIVCLLPPLPYGDSLAGKWVNVIMSSSNSNYIYLDFGYLADTNNAASFVQLATVRNTSYETLQQFNAQLSLPDGYANACRLAIRARSTSGDRWIRLDRIAVTNHPTPQNVSFIPHGVSQMQLTWSNTDSNPYYSIQYVPYAATPLQPVVPLALTDSCSALLTGLSPNTDYIAHFISPDGETNCLDYPFRTDDYQQLPYCDDFSSYPHSTNPPTDWVRYHSRSGWIEPCLNNSYEELVFRSYSGDICQIAMPDIDIDSIRHADIKFRMYSNNYSNNALIIGVMDTRNGFSTFTPVDTVRNSANNTWQIFHSNFARYHGLGRYITFRLLCSYGSDRLYIDDLEISPCHLPVLSVAGSTTIKAEVPHSGNVDYYIEYAPRSFAQGQQDTLWNADSTQYSLAPASTIVHVTQNPFYLENLNPSTTYTLYSRCDSLSPTCAAPTTITTAARQSLPLCDDFENYNTGSSVMPTGWAAYRMNGCPEPTVTSGNHIFFGNYCQNGVRGYAIMPDIDIDSVKYLDISFDMNSNRSSQQQIIVGVMSDPNDIGTFVPVDTVRNTADNAWQYMNVSLSKYNGIGRFVTFCSYSTSSNCMYMYIDNLRIQSCPQASASLSAGTTVRFDVDTSLSAPDYWIEYGPQGFAQLTEDTLWNADSTQYTLQPQGSIIHVTTNPFCITGLDENTTYDFYTRCDSAISTCFPVQRITTSSTLSLPYCEDFDSYSTGEYHQPTGWWAYHSQYDDNKYPDLYNYSDYSTSCCNSLYFYNYHNDLQYIALPDIEIDSIRNIAMTFNIRMWYSAYQYSRMIIGVMDNRLDFNTFTPIDTITCTNGDYYQTMHVSFAKYQGTGRFIAFRYLSTSGWRECFIDDLRIQACRQPSVSLMAGTTVRFDVDTTVSAPDYWIEYGPQDISQLAEDTVWNADSTQYSLQPHNTIVHVTSTPFFITGLDENTTYDFYTRCDSAVSTCFPVQRIKTSQVTPIPYCFDFSVLANNQMPQGWRRYSNDSSYPNYPYKYDHYLYFYKYSTTSICQAVMPDFDIDSIKNINLTFSITGDYLNEGIIVGVMTNPDDIYSFVPVDTLRLTQTGVWIEVKPRLYRYNGNGRFIALRELTTGTYHRVGANAFKVENCDIPAGTTATLHGSRTVRIDADAQSSTGFLVEYGPENFSQGQGTLVQVDGLPIDLELDYNTTYDFYFRCDTATYTCRPKQTVTTQSLPSPLPLCEDFEGYGNNFPSMWRMLRQNNSYGNVYTYSNADVHSPHYALHFQTYYQYHNYAILPDIVVDSLQDIVLSFWLKNYDHSSITVGAMSDPNDYNSFIPVRTLTSGASFQRHIVSFSALPSDARFIAFRSNSDYNNYGPRYSCLDDLYIDTIGASDFHITGIESDDVTFAWCQAGNPTMTIEYGPIGFARGTGTTVTASHPPFTISGLDPLTNYKFYFDATSQPNAGQGYCNTNYSDSATVFTPAGGTGCIDPTNLTADYTTCFYGTYGNPYANTGVVDYNFGDSRSRHTVHYDTTATDPRTGGMLRIVPEGSNASVRLGNWTSNTTAAEAEAISYSLLVDTTSFDLLVLKYAAVLQDPLHAPSDQPRFSLEVLDESNSLLDAQCAAADFIANRNLGWNMAAGNVLWKDWTTVGVDLSPYAGQRVRIRLTSRDCNEGSHFGYAYFTLECMKKNMRSEHCGDVDSNTFYAPAGFAYRWYSSNDTSQTLSTEQSIRVPTDSLTYFCRCSFVDNDECHFTISAFAGTRFPLALFDYSSVISNCQFEVSFTNNSTISADGITPLGTGEPCETALWDFGDGQISNGYHATHTYSAPGTYTVMLISAIADGSCSDTTTMTLTLSMPNSSHAITGPTSICQGDTISLQAHGASQQQWSTGSSDSIIYAAPSSSTLFLCLVSDTNGCSDTLSHFVTVHPVAYDTIHVDVPENNLPYSFMGNTYSADALDTFALSSMAGCDSIIYFSISVLNNVTASADSTICDNMLPLLWNDSLFTEAGSKQTLLHSSMGSDSLLTMTLHTLPSFSHYVADTICDNMFPYSWQDTLLAEAPAGSLLISTLLTAANGCDSTVTLRLKVNASTSSDTFATACDSFTWHGTEYTADGTPTYQTANSVGCDSVATLHLTINHGDSTAINLTACDSFVWDVDGMTYMNDTTLHTTIHTVAGCDSTIVLHLSILPSPQLVLIPDTVLQPGETLTLHAHGANVYTWHSIDGTALSNTSTLEVSPSQSSTYILTAFNQGGNLVYNGDFELGNIGFTTDYSYTTTSLQPEGYYAVGTDAHHYHYGFTGPHDHTTGSGNYMIVNGATGLNTNLWTQTVNVSPHTNYAFSVWGTNLSPYSQDYMANMQFAINGTQIGDIFQLPTTMDSWSQFYQVWNSDTNSVATITILNMNTQFAGNDFGIDDIFFANMTTCMSRDTVHVYVGQHVDTTVCESAFPFSWNGVTFTSPGAKTATLSSSTGEDSVVVMNVIAAHPTESIVVVTACDSYEWHGTEYTAGGTPTYQTVNSAGCDSVVTLHLTINHSSTGTETVTACNRYLWHGTEYTTSTSTPTFTTQNAVGCDSVTTLDLTIIECSTTEITACDSHTWHGLTYSASGTYIDGTDTLVLTINHSTTGTETATACDSYTWHGTVYTAGATPTYQTVNAAGCDSKVTLNLTVNYSTIGTENVTACDSYTWHGTVYTAGGTPTYQTVNSVGCDSVATLHLTINYSTSSDTAVTACDSFTWHDSTFTNSGTIQRYIEPNAMGCDSIVKLSLTIKYSTTGDTAVTACDSYEWHGTEYTAGGTPTYQTVNAAGCDSVVTLHLTINYSTNGDTTVSACDSYEWHGTEYTAGGTPTYQTVNSAGCDSVATLHLTINYSTNGDTTATACDSYQWHGTEYTAGGTPTFLTVNNAGCDSVVTLHLTINYSTATDTVATACDSFVWHDSTFTNSGTIQRYIAPNAMGCDSIVRLSLTINHTTTGDTTVSACDSYQWHGTEYTAGGTPTYQTVNAAGCDSVATLHLTINYSTTDDTTATACDSYLWHGTEYTAGGTPTYQTVNSAGCDSLTTLHLTINYSTATDTTVTACDSFQWHGTEYTAGGTHTYQTVNAAGCDSTATLHLTINPSYELTDHIEACEPLTWADGITYTTSIFGPTVRLTSAAGCDSVVTLDFVRSLGAFTQLTDTFCAGTSYHFAGQELTTGGVYYDTLQTVDLCDSVFELTLTMLPYPELTITDEADCERLVHKLTALTPAAHVRWSTATGEWNPDWGPSYTPTVYVRHHDVMTLTVTADYELYEVCPSTKEITIEPIRQPLAIMHLSPEQLTADAPTLVLHDRSTGAIGRGWWINSDDMGGASSFEYVAGPDDDTLLVLLVAYSEHCTDTASALVPVLRHSLFAPNAITPDESTNRDFFIAMEGIVDYELTIYNRQGLQVFHSTDPAERWDGTRDGTPCPQAAYVWVLRYTTNEAPRIPQVAKGSLLIIR